MDFKKFLFLFILSPIIFGGNIVSAHCPLCTIGAGAAAGAAVWLGVSKIVVALFIGAFAMSMGIWFSKIPKKRYISFQKTLIVIAVFFSTLLPLKPIVSTFGPLYISFIGAYGITYAVDYSFYSGLLGGILVMLSPTISKKITLLRNNNHFPFQGTFITLFMLLVVGIIIQLIV